MQKVHRTEDSEMRVTITGSPGQVFSFPLRFSALSRGEVREESVGQGFSSGESGLPLSRGLSPVCHQHLDNEVREKNQEGAGCIVFEGGECREPILQGLGRGRHQFCPLP